MLRKTSVLAQFDDLNKKFMDEKCYGIYNFRRRDIVVKDLGLAKRILIKDADHFIDRPKVNVDDSKIEGDKVFNYFLTQLEGEQWKKVRTLVSPIFTSGKLKMMVPHVQKCADNLDQVFAAASEFGIESNSFKEPDSVFRTTALRMTRAEGYSSKLDIVKFMILIMSPKLAKILGLSIMPTGTVEFFAKIIKQAVEQRRDTGQRRNDIIDFLLDEIKKIEDGDDKTETGLKKEDIDMELALISNALIFFFAGFDTSPLTLAVVIYCFIQKPAIQERARQEIEEVIG